MPMRTLILNVLTVIHFLSLTGLAIYGLHRIWMIACWLTRGRAMKSQAMPCPLIKWPMVTVQIPLYNEPLVAGRIIDATTQFIWPRDRLEIQVLDDSTDDTRRIVDERVAYWALKGINIYVIRRTHRTGYKAGALANGLQQSSGEFIAVFDADFIPYPDFLEKTIPHFHHPEVGMVQAKWGFLNARYSWLTRLQALLLSTHFGIEHEVRCCRGLFFNFNGTAGVWRKTAIETAGGWQSDTVTEDLDLSYRAQMTGWQFFYLNDVVVPSELPVTLSDFRCQQERWGKGAIQTARKLLPKLIASSLPVSVKIEAMAHLLANFCWMFGCIATLTLYPVLLNRIGIGVYQIIWLDLPLFTMTGISVLAYYLIYGFNSDQKQSVFILPILPAASIGLAPFFSLAVLKGLVQTGGVFTRTPKFAVLDSTPFQRFHFTLQPHVVANLMINLPLLIYTLAPVVFAWHRGTWPAIPFLALFPLGFCMVLIHDVHELWDVFMRRIRA
jgi:cellulose synthase/poly-beta-1,6-N-acetylglucosamine synthase-like glycosyltransferase